MLSAFATSVAKYVTLDTSVASDVKVVQVCLLGLLVVTTLVLGFHVFMPAVASLSESKEQLMNVVDRLPTKGEWAT